MTTIANFINGQARAGVGRFEDINPADGSVVAEVAEASPAMVDEAVESARRALAGPWGKATVTQRADALYRIAAGIEARFADFLAAEIADTGKPVTLASKLDIPRGAANFRAFADLIRTQGLECFQTDTPDGAAALNYAVRKPVGVVGVISPWNLPLLLMTWKVAPALACGNTVVAKPSELTPATATLLGEVMCKAEIPDGVFNVVHGFGPGSAGEFLAAHPGVNAITFTGESQTGSAIMRTVAPTLKPVSFELGGKNPALVFADCDFERTVAGLVRALFLNSGQVCLCAERLYVERPLYQRLVARLAEEAGKLVLGWPRDPATTIGPLISREHREKVFAYFALAKEEGAATVVGGGVPKFGDARDAGAWIEPTVFTGLPENARCMREEIFGPVCHVTPFDSEEQSIAMANDTDYGLAASVWTSNIDRGHRVAARLNVGIAWVNCWFLRDLRTPFGGAGRSGIGREGGLHSLNFYSELTNVCVHIDPRA